MYKRSSPLLTRESKRMMGRIGALGILSAFPGSLSTMDDRASFSPSHFAFSPNAATPHAATLAREEETRGSERESERARASRRRETVHKAAKYGKGGKSGKGCICPARGCCLSPVVILQSAVSTLSLSPSAISTCFVSLSRATFYPSPFLHRILPALSRLYFNFIPSRFQN